MISLDAAIYLGRTPLGVLHPFALFQQVIDFGEVDARIRRHTVGGDFPQQDAEGPDVGFGGELVVG